MINVNCSFDNKSKTKDNSLSNDSILSSSTLILFRWGKEKLVDAIETIRLEFVRYLFSSVVESTNDENIYIERTDEQHSTKHRGARLLTSFYTIY
jgi:hypothetical protein